MWLRRLCRLDEESPQIHRDRLGYGLSLLAVGNDRGQSVLCVRKWCHGSNGALAVRLPVYPLPFLFFQEIVCFFSPVPS